MNDNEISHAEYLARMYKTQTQTPQTRDNGASAAKKPYTRVEQLFDAVLYEAEYNDSPAVAERLFQLAARLVPFLK